jgi:steroid 5-alpha reductase family enzyme
VSWGPLLVNLAVTAVTVAVLMLATFAYAMRTRETAGDWQLLRWRASPLPLGEVLDRGLWRYTRHPNYFGDAVVSFGPWLLACSHWLGVLTVAAPVYMTNMLVRHTGKRLLEKHMARSKRPRTPTT